jgi:hypothetical protein
MVLGFGPADMKTISFVFLTSPNKCSLLSMRGSHNLCTMRLLLNHRDLLPVTKYAPLIFFLLSKVGKSDFLSGNK